jgi:Manganese containing catalase
MNYTFHSFNFRGKEKYRPFYDLICNIAAEEYSHIEAVAATINLLLNGAVPRADRNKPFGEDADSKKKKAANKKDFGDANPAPLSDPASITSPTPVRRQCPSTAWAIHGTAATSPPQAI